jgi:hypothetical protein
VKAAGFIALAMARLLAAGASRPPPQRHLLDLAAADAHPVEEQLEVELRMGLDRAAAKAGRLVGLVRPERLPFVLGHIEVEAGKDHRPLVEAGDDPQQPGDGGRGAGDSGGGDEARRRRAPPALRDRGEQAVAAIGEVDPAALGEQLRPLVEDDAQPIERFLPVEREIGQLGGETAQSRRVDLLDQQLVEGAGEILGEAQSFGRLDPAEMALDQPGEQEQPLERLDRGRQPLLFRAQRLERAADPLVSSGSPTGTSRGRSRPPPERRTKASATARAARLLGTSTIPRARPISPRP